MGSQEVRDTLDPQPLQLVAYFHQLLGHKQDTFADKEKARAAELLRRYSADEVRALIDYAVEKMKASKYEPDFFGAVMRLPAELGGTSYRATGDSPAPCGSERMPDLPGPRRGAG